MEVHPRSDATLLRLAPIPVFECQQCEVRPDCAPRPVSDPFAYLRPFDVVLGPERNAVKPVRQVCVCRVDDSLLHSWGGSTGRDDVYNIQLAIANV